MGVMGNIFAGSGPATASSTTTANVVEKAKRTTDATPTDVVEIPIAEEKAVQLQARIMARKSDGTILLSNTLSVLAYRNTGGNVTIAGDILSIDSHATDGCVYTATVVANTTNQSAAVRCTGAAGATVDWVVNVNYMKN